MVNWRSKNGLPQRSGSTGAPLIKLAVSLRVSGGIWLRRSPDSAIKGGQKVLSDRGCIGRQPNVLCPQMRHGWGDECKAAGFSFAGGFAVFENTNSRLANQGLSGDSPAGSTRPVEPPSQICR